MSDLDDIFAGDKNIDPNTKYERPETIGAAGNPSIDAFAMFSHEISSDKYKIRTPAQQSEWAKKKSSNQKTLVKYLLRLDSVILELISACDGTEKMLFGRLKTNSIWGIDNE